MNRKTAADKQWEADKAKLREVIAGVNEAAEGITREEFAEGAERILKVFTGCPFHIWQTYDDQYWKQPGFWLARSVRNHPNWGPRLFKALTS